MSFIYFVICPCSLLFSLPCFPLCTKLFNFHVQSYARSNPKLASLRKWHVRTDSAVTLARYNPWIEQLRANSNLEHVCCWLQIGGQSADPGAVGHSGDVRQCHHLLQWHCGLYGSVCWEHPAPGMCCTLRQWTSSVTLLC
jgi:hypothetical protein